MSKLLQEIKEGLGEDLQGERFGDAAAVIGVDSISCRLIFSIRKQIELLMERDGMKRDEAREYVIFNYVGARGSDEPIWMDDDLFES